MKLANWAWLAISALTISAIGCTVGRPGKNEIGWAPAGAVAAPVATPSQEVRPVAAQLSSEDRYEEYVTMPRERARARELWSPSSRNCSFG